MTAEPFGDKVRRRLAQAVVTSRISLPGGGPRVSFTFDDIPLSAARTGARILEERGARATFYVCGGLAGTDWEAYPLASLDEVIGLSRAGHEIGCHTASHLNGFETGSRAYLRDVESNARLLEPIVGPLRTFAYPYGSIGLGQKLLLQRRFAACRGVHGVLLTSAADRGRLEAVALENASIGQARIDALLDDVVAQGAWLVFYSHDVVPAPSRFGVTPELLSYAVEGALRRGCRIETVRDVVHGDQGLIG